MAAFQANQATVPQDIVTKVGVAAGHIARIQQDYLTQVETENSNDVRETLVGRARDAADEDLERRLLDAAREVL